MNCKYCQSPNIIKFGTHTTADGVEIQRYFCNDCKRKFVPDTLPKMQIPVNQVAAAVSMYYEGLSLNEIKRIIKQIYNKDVSDFGIYIWVERFTKDAIKITDHLDSCNGTLSGRRSGDTFYRENGERLDADTNGARNVLARLYDSEIGRWTPYKEVKSILLKRTECYRLKLLNQDSSCSQLGLSTESELPEFIC